MPPTPADVYPASVAGPQVSSTRCTSPSPSPAPPAGGARAVRGRPRRPGAAEPRGLGAAAPGKSRCPAPVLGLCRVPRGQLCASATTARWAPAWPGRCCRACQCQLSWLQSQAAGWPGRLPRLKRAPMGLADVAPRVQPVSRLRFPGRLHRHSAPPPLHCPAGHGGGRLPGGGAAGAVQGGVVARAALGLPGASIHASGSEGGPPGPAARCRPLGTAS